jgi:hypothetical protein
MSAVTPNVLQNHSRMSNIRFKDERERATSIQSTVQLDRLPLASWMSSNVTWTISSP